MPTEKHNAKREFLIPTGAEVLLCHPEFLDRDICRHEKAWRTAAHGVRMPCPHCGKNNFLTQNGYSCGNKAPIRKCLQDSDSIWTCVVGVQYKCTNPAACGKVPEGGK